MKGTLAVATAHLGRRRCMATAPRDRRLWNHAVGVARPTPTGFCNNPSMKNNSNNKKNRRITPTTTPIRFSSFSTAPPPPPGHSVDFQTRTPDTVSPLLDHHDHQWDDLERRSREALLLLRRRDGTTNTMNTNTTNLEPLWIQLMTEWSEWIDGNHAATKSSHPKPNASRRRQALPPPRNLPPLDDDESDTRLVLPLSEPVSSSPPDPQQQQQRLHAQQLQSSATERMVDLYQAWRLSSPSSTTNNSESPAASITSSDTTTTTTNISYELLLRVFSRNGPRALAILQDWELALAGDMELAPRECHYQAVLAAYAADPTHTNTSHSSSHDTNHSSSVQTTTSMESSSSNNEAPDVALEIVQHLENSWSSSAQEWPNLQTYQNAVHIVARALRQHVAVLLVHSSSTTHSNQDHSETTQEMEHSREKVQEHSENLQMCMDKFLQKVSPRRMMTEEQFFSMALTLRDAIQAWKVLQFYLDSSIYDATTEDDAANTDWEAQLRNAFALDDVAMHRRSEWCMHWGKLLQIEHSDLWWRLKDNFTESDQYIGTIVLEQTCMAVLEMHHSDFLRHLNEVTRISQSLGTNNDLSTCIGSVEAMTHHVLQLSDMMEATVPESSPTFSSSTSAFGSFLPSGRHYRITLQAWGHLKRHARVCKQNDYVVLSEQQQDLLLQRMYAQHLRNHSPNPQTTAEEHEHATNSWNDLLRAHLDAGVPDRVKELWDQNAVAKVGRIRRNSESYTALLQALAAKRENDTNAKERAEQAHSILNKLISFDPAKRNFEPHPEHFASVMIAWSRSFHPDAATYCQQVFDRMSTDDVRSSTNDDLASPARNMVSSLPCSTHYRSLITTWGFSRLPGATQRVLELFRQMKAANIANDVTSYSGVLFALSRSQSVVGAEEAEAILNEMEEELHSKTIKSDRRRRNWNNSMHYESGRKRLNYRSDEYADADWFMDDRIESHKHLDYNNDEFDNGYSTAVDPNLACYNAVLYAWCHSGALEAPQRCESVFRRLMTAFEKSSWDLSLRPDSTSFATLIDSIVKQSSKTSGADIVARAEDILLQMQAQAAEGLSDYPDAKVYTSVMKAHWKSGQPDAALRVEDVIRRMKESFESGNTAAKPDCHAMTVLLQTWAKSDVPNKASIAWEIHKEMRNAYEQGDLDMNPNTYSLTAVLNACAFTKSQDQQAKSEAVKVALMAMNELDNGVGDGLNEFTFREMFHVVVSQIDDLKERTRFAGVIFQRCCQAGYVSRSTLASLKAHVPSLYRKLPSSQDNKLNLPEQWTRHVAKSDRHDSRWVANR